MIQPDETKIKMLNSSQRMNAPESRAASLNVRMPHYRSRISVGQVLGLLLILLLALPFNASAAWGLRTAWTSSNPAGTDTTITFTFATTTATDLLVCAVSWSAGGVTPVSVADGLAQTWTQAYYVNHTRDQALYYFENTGAGSSVVVTATLSATSSGRTMACAAYSGIATSSALDRTIGQLQENPGTGTDAVTSTATSALTASDELVIGSITGNEEGITYTVGTGFTSRLNEDNPAATTSHWLIEDRTLSTPSTAAATATVSSTTVDTTAIVATFKIAGAAAAAGCVLGIGFIC